MNDKHEIHKPWQDYLMLNMLLHSFYAKDTKTPQSQNYISGGTFD